MNEETQASQTESAVETTTKNQTEKTVDASVATDTEKSKELQSAIAQKEHFRQKAEKAEAERKALEARLNEAVKNGPKPSLDVEDYIDISASLMGLDSREQAKLASEHKLTGKPLKELRSSEDFTLWQTAYRQKLEKEKALTPSGKQTESERPKTLTDKLKNASMSEQEKILSEAGLWKSPRPRIDRVKIG